MEKILTDNADTARPCLGREFCGREFEHPFELFLALNDIKHKRTKVRSPQTNGFVERFHRTVLDEFFRVKMRTTFYESVEALQTDLDEWLRFYNEERPHLGYRNMGKRPLDTIRLYREGKQSETTTEPGAENAGETAPILASLSARHEG